MSGTGLTLTTRSNKLRAVEDAFPRPVDDPNRSLLAPGHYSRNDPGVTEHSSTTRGVRVSGTDLEQFRNAMSNPAARQLLGLMYTDEQASWLLADHGRLEGAYTAWLAAPKNADASAVPRGPADQLASPQWATGAADQQTFAPSAPAPPAVGNLFQPQFSTSLPTSPPPTNPTWNPYAGSKPQPPGRPWNSYAPNPTPSGARALALAAGVLAIASVPLGIPLPGIGVLGGGVALVMGLVALWLSNGSVFTRAWAITGIAVAPVAAVLSAPFQSLAPSMLALSGAAVLTLGVLAVARPRRPESSRAGGITALVVGSLTVLGAGVLFVISTDAFRAGWIASDVDQIEDTITLRWNEQAAEDDAPWRAVETICDGVTSLDDGTEWPCTTFFDDGDEVAVTLVVEDGKWDWWSTE